PDPSHNPRSADPAVTQGLAEASRNREDVRTELFRALEAVRFHNNSCEPCPTSWLSFEGSCYFFSVPKTTWAAAQGHCANASAHLVIVGGLEEQGFLTRNTRGRGYWLGLRAVRHLGKVQGYQWVDGVSLSFSHWNRGEPNDARGREDCVMMLRTGLWNDAPCDSEKDGWICEKSHAHCSTWYPGGCSLPWLLELITRVFSSSSSTTESQKHSAQHSPVQSSAWALGPPCQPHPNSTHADPT
uniref:C-type lectin domain family 4 member G n=1 Tax=Piliocolobus tephrosceles TaxID=591936 RepID=A0A8C9GRZ6_9PRIM